MGLLDWLFGKGPAMPQGKNMISCENEKDMAFSVEGEYRAAIIENPRAYYPKLNESTDPTITWPSARIKQVACEAHWGSWRPEKGDEGEVIHTICDPDLGTVLVLKIGERYVPIGLGSCKLVKRITFSCSSCHAELRANPEGASKRVKCPKCGHANQVPCAGVTSPLAAAAPSSLKAAPPVPQTAPNRALSRQLNDAAIAAAKCGDNNLAEQKWLEAAKADPTFSGPAFNLARYLITNAPATAEVLDAVKKYLDAAERNASSGSEGEDSRVLKQLPTLRAWLQIKIPGTKVRCRFGSNWVHGVITEGSRIQLADGSRWEGPINMLLQAIDAGQVVVEEPAKG